jgi:hypothetical protein
MKRILARIMELALNASVIIAVAVVSAIVLPVCFVGEIIEKKKGGGA